MPDTRPVFYGSFRESNAHHLEVLGQAPATGVPIEVDVFDGASPGTLLDTLEGATGVRFQKVLNDVGAFRFLISRGDPKATPDLVDREHLIKVKVGSVYRFSGWAEVRRLQTLDAQDEEAGEVWEISGRDGIGYLDRAAMANYSLIGDDPIAGVWDLSAAGTGDSIGAMFNRCIQERLAEPGSAIEFLTVDFDYDYDSLGNAWNDTAKLKVDVGDSLLSIWRTMTALGMDSRIRHDLRLQAFVELGRHYDIDTGDGTVVLEAGKDFITTLVKTKRTADIKTREWVKGQTGTYFEAIRSDLESDPYIRRREGSLSFGSSTDPTTLQRAAFADMQHRALQVEGGVEVEVWNGRYQPFVHYDVGDWITVHEPGVYDNKTFRVVAITIDQDEDNYRTTLALNSVELEDLLRLAAKMLGAEMGSVANSASAVSSGGSGGGGGTGSDYKVAVETGDEAGFLIDKVQGADGVTRSMVGPVGDRKVQLGLDSMLVQLKAEKGVANGYVGLDSGILVPASYLGTGTPDATKFLRGDRVWAAPPAGVDSLNDLTDVDTATTPPTDGQALVYDLAGAVWKPGDVASGGGGGGAAAVYDKTETNSTVVANSAGTRVLHTRTIDLPAGKYGVVGKTYVWTGSGGGSMYLTKDGAQLPGTVDPGRSSKGEKVLFAAFDHAGGSTTLEIRDTWEFGSYQHGEAGDGRFGREMLIYSLGAGGGSTIDKGYETLFAPQTITNAEDDNFDDATLDAKWSVLQGTPDLASAPGWLTFGAAGLVQQPLPAGDWNLMTELIVDSVWSAGYAKGGLFLSNSATLTGTQRYFALGANNSLTGNWRLLLENFVNNGFNSTHTGAVAILPNFDGRIFLRIQKVGTQYRFMASQTGLRWYTWTVTSSLGITPTHFGLKAEHPGLFNYLIRR